MAFSDDAGNVAGKVGDAALTGYQSYSHSSDDYDRYRTRTTDHDSTGRVIVGKIRQGKKEKEHIPPGGGRRRNTYASP